MPELQGGDKFGRLTAVEFVERRKNNGQYWLFRCDCGTEKVCRVGNVIIGHTKSCGCLDREMTIERNTKHGLSHLPEFRVWCGLIKRCRDVNDTSYFKYGARGIYVCDRWLQFENFYADMRDRPSKFHSIERIDNNGPYAPENCRWATPREQARNRRNNRLVRFNGREMSLAEASELSGLSYELLKNRIRRRWPMGSVFQPSVR